MVDITTIQTFAIAPSLKVLQDSNKLLTKENTILKQTIVTIIVVAGLYIIYQMIKKNNENIPTKKLKENR